MTAFEQNTPHSKKRTVILITAAVAIVLLGLLVITTVAQTNSGQVPQNDTWSVLQNFYTTILTTGQSYFGSK